MQASLVSFSGSVPASEFGDQSIITFANADTEQAVDLAASKKLDMRQNGNHSPVMFMEQGSYIASSAALTFQELIELLTAEHATQVAKINELTSEIHALHVANARSSHCPYVVPGIMNDETEPLIPAGSPTRLYKDGEPLNSPKIKPEAPKPPLAQRQAWQGPAHNDAADATKDRMSNSPPVGASPACDSGLRTSSAPDEPFQRQTSQGSKTSTRSKIRMPPRRGFPLCCFGGGRRLSVSAALEAGDVKYARESHWVINPDQSAKLMKWDQVTIAALLFVAIVTPVEVGMMETKLDALFVINRIIDCIFLTDMVLQFFLMYPVKTNFGVMMEGSHPKIIRRYLRGWFIIDFFSIQQFDVIGLVMNSEAMQKAKVVKIIRLLRLLKLVKVSIAARIFHRIEVRFSVTYQKLALYKFLILLVFISHWLACCWAMTLTLVDAEPDVSRWVDDLDQLDKTGLTDTSKDKPSLYLASIYFVSYTITSVGYGDIGPKNVVERIVCTLMIFVAGIVWAYVLGQVCGIIGSMGMLEQEFRKSMDDLNYMMQDRELPHDMRRRLRSFFLSTKDLQRHDQQIVLLDRMSPALQGEVAITTNREWLRKVCFMRPLLDNAQKAATPDERAPAYIVQIAMILRQKIYAQGELFGKPKTLYILQKGLVSRRMNILRNGSVWGEDFVLSDPKLVQSTICHALTYIQVSQLQRDEFFHMVSKHRKSFPELQKAVRRFQVRLGFQRGLILAARQQQLKEGIRPGDCVGRGLNVDASDSDFEEDDFSRLGIGTRAEKMTGANIHKASLV